MTEKRFTVWNAGLLGQYIKKNGTPMHIEEVVDLLNNLSEENEYIKHTIQEAYKTERTHIGKSVIQQLLEQL